MNYFDILLAKKLNGGGGGDITVESLSVTENGTYSEEGVAYSPVRVNVPTPTNAYLLNDIPSGEISTFNADNLPMPSLKVSVEAKQDLHGYDKPWVGGAGKNKVEPENYTTTAFDGTTYPVLNEGAFIAKTKTLPAGNYTASIKLISSPNANRTIQVRQLASETPSQVGSFTGINNYTLNQTYSFQFSLSESATIDMRLWGAGGDAFKIQIQIESGNQATSFEPYENVCPISGWDEANVLDRGKNLFDKNAAETGKGLNRNTGETTTVGNWSVSDYIKIKENTTYTYSDNEVSVANGVVFCYYDSNKGFISGIYDIPKAVRTITTPSNAVYVRFEISNSALTVLQFELGSTATTYEPYNGVTTTISLGQTVYGGEVDVVNGTSGNKLTHDIVDLGTLSWSYSSGQGRFSTTSLADVIKPTSGRSVDGLLCSCFECAISGTDNYLFMSGTTIYVYDSAYTDASAFTTAVTGQTLSYELATPTTLTTQPTPIKSLDGINNLSVDCGEILEGEYFKALGGD